MPGLFVKLDVEWVDHEKLIEAGLDGAGLHATALCLAKRSNTDGWLTRTLLTRYGATENLLDRLVALRLLEVDGSRYRPWGWLDRNPSQGAIDATRTAKAEAAKAGNHKRWGHPGDVANCPTCNPSEQVSRISDRSGSQDDRNPSPESETETETDPSSSQSEPTTPPSPEEDEVRITKVARILGEQDHAAADAAGKVLAATEHGRRKHLEACIANALNTHSARIRTLLGSHPDWDAQRIAAAVTDRTCGSVPLEQSSNPAVLSDSQRREREAQYAREQVGDYDAGRAKARAALKGSRASA